MVNTKRLGLIVAGVVMAAGLVLAVAATRRVGPGQAASRPHEPAVATGDPLTMAAAPHLLFRHSAIDAHYNFLSVASLADPEARRAATGLQCDRVSFAAGHGICLQTDRGLFTSYNAVVFDARFERRASLKLDGSPTRTRVSPDGRVGAITVFLTGQLHGYSSASFSTKTTMVDMASGEILGDLEQFHTWRDGQRFSAKDFNFWGVTFARNSNEFYATLLTDKKTYLVRGDLALRRLTVLHGGVECPSLSPNNTLIAFKKRVGGDLAPWRFHVLDLATMIERPIAAETRSIDDQIEWFDDAHVLYATRRNSQSAITDVWIAPIEGAEPARVLLSQAESPILVR